MVSFPGSLHGNEITMTSASPLHCKYVYMYSSQIGTYQLAVMAKALNKPFYVVAESFKVVRIFPLNQEDLPNVEKVRLSTHTCHAKYLLRESAF